MANIGDKSFTTQMVGAIESVIENTIGNDAGTNRFTAQVMAVDYVNSTVDVRLPGTSVDSTGFTVNGTQMPVIGDYVIVYINQSERWVDTVYRTATSSPYLSVVSGSLNAYGTNNFGAPTGAVTGWLFATPPSGWLLLDGGIHAYNTYPSLGALFGATAGGNFTLPDMRDRFIGGLAAVGTWANTGGAIGPSSTITNSRAHTHTTDIAHGHANNIAVAEHTSHTHPVDIGSTTTSQESVVTGSTFAYTVSGATATYRNHTHTVNPSGDTATANTLNTTDTEHTVSGSVTDLAATSVTSSAATYSGSNISPKATLLNFIIKT